jgi:hypothetical protein
MERNTMRLRKFLTADSSRTNCNTLLLGKAMVMKRIPGQMQRMSMPLYLGLFASVNIAPVMLIDKLWSSVGPSNLINYCTPVGVHAHFFASKLLPSNIY